MYMHIVKLEKNCLLYKDYSNYPCHSLKITTTLFNKQSSLDPIQKYLCYCVDVTTIVPAAEKSGPFLFLSLLRK